MRYLIVLMSLMVAMGTAQASPVDEQVTDEQVVLESSSEVLKVLISDLGTSGNKLVRFESCRKPKAGEFEDDSNCKEVYRRELTPEALESVQERTPRLVTLGLQEAFQPQKSSHIVIPAVLGGVFFGGALQFPVLKFPLPKSPLILAVQVASHLVATGLAVISFDFWRDLYRGVKDYRHPQEVREVANLEQLLNERKLTGVVRGYVEARAFGKVSRVLIEAFDAAATGAE